VTFEFRLSGDCFSGKWNVDENAMRVEGRREEAGR
jgi:hypothetical protein